MTDMPEIRTFELTYEWPVVIILGSGERLNLSTLAKDAASQGILAAPLLASVDGH